MYSAGRSNTPEAGHTGAHGSLWIVSVEYNRPSSSSVTVHLRPLPPTLLW